MPRYKFPERNAQGELVIHPVPVYVTVLLEGSFHVKRVDVYPPRTVAVFTPQLYYRTSRGLVRANPRIVKPKMSINNEKVNRQFVPASHTGSQAA